MNVISYVIISVDLHRLLHWRQNIERLPSILTAVTKVPGDEIVKVSFNILSINDTGSQLPNCKTGGIS